MVGGGRIELCVLSRQTWQMTAFQKLNFKENNVLALKLNRDKVQIHFSFHLYFP
jgi:hypothetical protein